MLCADIYFYHLKTGGCTTQVSGSQWSYKHDVKTKTKQHKLKTLTRSLPSRLRISSAAGHSGLLTVANKS